jgi:alcohol oxidase
MVYNRAPPSDYDAWENIYGNKGWGSDKLIPLLKKVVSWIIPSNLNTELPSQAETYQEDITNDTHGTAGPIKVSFSKEYNNVAINFLEVAGAYDKDRALTDDINAFTSCNQYGVSNTLSSRIFCL